MNVIYFPKIEYLPYTCKHLHVVLLSSEKRPAGLFPAILGKGPWPKLGKMIDLKSKLGEINDIEHNKGSKIYPQNQVIFYCTN